MPLVGMKLRPYYDEQIVQLSQHVSRPAVGPDGKPITGPDGKPGTVFDVGLACGLLSVELLLDIRDILLQMALAPIWWNGQSAMMPNQPLLVAKEIPR